MMNTTRTNESESFSLHQGFSLLELLIAMAILAIISSVSIVSYKQHIVKSRRTEAQTGLMSLIAQAEQYYLQNNSRYPTSAAELTLPQSSYYIFTGESCGNGCFRAIARATGSQLEANNACSTLTLDTNGTRTPAADGCWNR